MKTKYIKILVTGFIVCLVTTSVYLFPGIFTENRLREPEKTQSVPAVNLARTDLASDGLAHVPSGWDNLYGSKEVPQIWWDRSPWEPMENEKVTIQTAVSGPSSEMDIWIEWTKNGVLMQPVPCRHTANLKADGITKKKYSGALGSFSQGDRIEYAICAGTDRQAEKWLGVFSFSVTGWEPVQQTESVTSRGTETLIDARAGSLPVQIGISFRGDGTVKFALSAGGGDGEAGVVKTPSKAETTLVSGDLSLKMQKAPFSWQLSKGDRLLLSDIGADGLEIRTDGTNIYAFRMSLEAKKEEGYYGFGMRYDSLNQRRKTVDIYCVNWYTEQEGQTYTPVPYYFVPDTYGLFLDSTYYSRFAIDTDKKGVCVIETAVGGSPQETADIYLYTGTNKEIAGQYARTAGTAALPPVWAFGPWISANEWNKQSEVMEQLEQTLSNEIPTTVIVLEAWSDEETFYTFNDSVYTPQQGNHVPDYADFRFEGRWPDPKGMVEALHDHEIKVLLWQIPVLKQSSSATIQSLRDQRYAVEQNYVMMKDKKTPYRLPTGTWFGGSLLIDFTSSKATDWFLEKRRYLLEDIGVDGFKTDGGEFIWGKAVTASDGRKGDELRNAYPDLYAQAYFDFSRSISEDAITFSRAGGSTMQQHPLCWIGDQTSTKESFGDAIRAQLSASMSGIPFVAWDIAGFSGDVPDSDLYMRSVAQAAFSAVMQVHSETSGDPVPSKARTPWNMAERKGSTACLDTYRYFANVRMNLLPYIYTEAKYSSESGEPLMRSMAYQYPQDKKAQGYEYQYMFGRSILVAPVIDVSRDWLEVYLPEGIWYGLSEGKQYVGGIHKVSCESDEIPVFVKSGTILPLNTDSSGMLGSYVGNGTAQYTQLTFNVYPGEGTYEWYDYVNERTASLIHEKNSGLTVNNVSEPFKIIWIGAD